MSIKSNISRKGNKRPAEIFGFPIDNNSEEAKQYRTQYRCPFINKQCTKKSRLLNYPFGVCTAEFKGNIHTICPHRFNDVGTIEGVPKVLEDIAVHYFGNYNNILIFSEVQLKGIGTIDYVLVRHKPMQAEVEDFIAVEFQSDSTTSTGGLIEGIRDFFEGKNIKSSNYHFGMNTYDTIKRAITQLMNKGIVYETWNIKSYWVIQQYIYDNLVKRYGFKQDGYFSEDASRFALYNFEKRDNRLFLKFEKFISTSVDEVYRAMCSNKNLPNKDKFIQQLNVKLESQLKFDINQ